MALSNIQNTTALMRNATDKLASIPIVVCLLPLMLRRHQFTHQQSLKCD